MEVFCLPHAAFALSCGKEPQMHIEMEASWVSVPPVWTRGRVETLLFPKVNRTLIPPSSVSYCTVLLSQVPRDLS